MTSSRHDAPSQVPSYGTYLRLETLLAAQRPPDFAKLREGEDPTSKTRDLAHHDELLFIVIHQIYELWFKQINHELRFARDVLARRDTTPRRAFVREEDIPRVVLGVQRINEILRIGAEQWRVLETMQPTSFLEFRNLISPGSGFQSVQFREMELLAGLSEEVRIDFEGVPYEANLAAADQAHLAAVRRQPSLRDGLFDWLSRTPIDRAFPGFAEAFLAAFARYAEEQAHLQDLNPNLAASQRDNARKRLLGMVDDARRYLLGGPPEQNHAHQAFVFIASYRHEALLRWPAALIDALVEFEEYFRIFRFRHARMVERMIGNRTGTGGSPGLAYLERTAGRYRIFGDLLEARSFLLATSEVPPLPNPTLLDFRFAPEYGT